MKNNEKLVDDAFDHCEYLTSDTEEQSIIREAIAELINVGYRLTKGEK